MRIVAISMLRQFWEKQPDAEQSIKAWVDETNKATWMQPVDIKARYRSVSILKNRRVVFNITGNDYRLIVVVAFKLGIIKFRMEQGGLTPKDLEPMIGKRNRVYEVLNRKRNFMLPMNLALA